MEPRLVSRGNKQLNNKITELTTLQWSRGS